MFAKCGPRLYQLPRATTPSCPCQHSSGCDWKPLTARSGHFLRGPPSRRKIQTHRAVALFHSTSHHRRFNSSTAWGAPLTGSLCRCPPLCLVLRMGSSTDHRKGHSLPLPSTGTNPSSRVHPSRTDSHKLVYSQATSRPLTPRTVTSWVSPTNVNSVVAHVDPLPPPRNPLLPAMATIFRNTGRICALSAQIVASTEPRGPAPQRQHLNQ